MLIFLGLAFLGVDGQHDCNDFTFSDCNIEDNVVWENDQVKQFFQVSFDTLLKVGDEELCQKTCTAIATCEFFFFDNGTCRLFR